MLPYHAGKNQNVDFTFSNHTPNTPNISQKNSLNIQWYSFQIFRAKQSTTGFCTVTHHMFTQKFFQYSFYGHTCILNDFTVTNQSQWMCHELRCMDWITKSFSNSSLLWPKNSVRCYVAIHCMVNLSYRFCIKTCVFFTS